ncbi:hypothetical protein [Martelella mangrovi]|uniref:Uncharacterized protein n=1 Tax=Martelella mangrovi TaxID=1397477 RepID=A0ABV2IG17_9HYPH
MKFLITILVSLVPVTLAMAQDYDDKLSGALWTEWLVANCDLEQIPAMDVIVANMVINGSEPDKVSEIREFIRNEWHKHYRSSAEACAETLGSAEGGQGAETPNAN